MTTTANTTPTSKPAKARGPYGERTVPMRVPASMVAQVRAMLANRLHQAQTKSAA
ncbi:hypothetical protein [Dyella sp. ASV21]|uniref:hypothetical protein n=1 Tax=Dyella sp. ASV21 TaxID=2795114 RepID=UPI0018EC8A5F|nr:hypothetical protein [Dyella sp. ASV21]